MQQQAFLNAGLQISTYDRRPGQEEADEMRYDGGIREYVDWLNSAKTPIHDGVIYMRGQKDDASVEIAMQYSDSYNETIVSFANDVRTPEGGMHEEGFKRALTTVLNNYGKKTNIIKGEDKVSGDDCRRASPASSPSSSLTPSSRARPRRSWATPTSAPWSPPWWGSSWRCTWRRTPRWPGRCWTRP